MPATQREPFVGRSDELAVLQHALAAVRRGQPQVVLVEGDPGIGKTALLRRFLRKATGVRVLWASGDESEVALEFGVVGQLWAAIPPVAAGASELRAGMSSLAVGVALLSRLGVLEQRGPAVLVVDDLHCVDLASARALLFLLRRLRRDPLLVVAAARPAALDRLGDGWARLLADGHLAARVRLTGLNCAEVRELAAVNGRPLPAPAGERLRAHTAGNPLYVSALLAELPDDALRDDSGSLPAPHSYAATVLARLARLSRPAQALVASAAVHGTRAPLRVVAETAGLDDPIDAVDEAVAAGLLELATRRGWQQVRFAHPLVRAAVYADLSPLRRRSLHGSAARVLDRPAAYRHRVAATAGVDAQLAVELCQAAESDLAVGVLTGAAGLFELAARVEPDPVRADLCLYRSVELLLIGGDVFGADSLAQEVHTRTDSPYKRYVTALLGTPTGQFTQSAAELRAVVRSASPIEEPDLYARSTSALAFISAMLGDDEQTIGWARRARTVPGRVATVDTLARQALAWSFAKTGRIAEAMALLADCAPEHGQPAAFETELLAIRGAVRNWVGELPGALADLRAVARWVRLGFPVTDIAHVYAAMAEAELRSGDWESAATHVELAVSLGEDLDHGWYLPYAHAVAAHLYAVRGDDSFAAAHASAAARAAGAGPAVDGILYAALAEAHRAWALGEWVAVTAALRPLQETVDGPATHHPNLGAWRYRIAEAWIAEDRPDDALRLLDRVPAPPWGGSTVADRARLRALAMRRRGDPEGAATVFAEGMADLHGAPTTLAGALLALDYGRFLVETGRSSAAVAPLRASRDVVRRLGASRIERACTEVLASCGRIGSPRAAPPAARLDTLTERERVVAHLVAGGATNKEVAAELYLSVKAIEYHLGNIFPKLGISSRRQLRIALGRD